MLRRRWFLIFSLLLVISTNFYRHLIRDLFSFPSDRTVTTPSLHHPTTTKKLQFLELIHETTTTAQLPSPPITESVLFPDWEVFVLLPSDTITPIGDYRNVTCLFHNGAVSPANHTDWIPSSARDGFLCKMPPSVQRLRPLLTPKLIGLGNSVITGSDSARPAEMVRWNRLVYESLSTTDDVIVFAKGVNRVQGRDRRAEYVTCVFSVNGAVSAITAASSSAQEVFRCPHPKNLRSNEFDDVRVSVKIAGDESAIPTLAVYRPPPVHNSGSEDGQLTCACTMVYNAAKFLKEWVAYHAAIGVDKFVLYDNGSDDDIGTVLSQLGDEGYDVSRVYWPWQKSQEAGFSHFAASYRSRCAWTAFIDVDEFVYSPSWSESIAPNKSMIRDAVIGPERPDGRIGQVQMTCNDFGPSGQRAHPRAGVTQGYTCHLRPKGRRQRHKSMVRMVAVAGSLKNSVHHFEVGEGWGTRRARGAVVNHYKYQAWSEFRKKFRRRVSAYVADWKERRNEGSKDRVPGLGFEEVEPPGWEKGMCEVRDFGLRDVVKRWFRQPDERFAWEVDQ